jgi:type IV pilus assembly protein PilM
MADSQAVWGIDIGQYALKAIKLRYLEGAGQVAAVAFDYIPFPKILSQPDAIPEELVPEALNTFLSRNKVKDDLVAVSVPGHAALTRFIQLPPVESGKLAEIVKYEARQQIPFALEEVIWDFQPLGSGIEESGYLLDAEVGLFAMKRNDVMQHLRPYTNAKLEVELIQIAPLALFNYLCYDELGIRPGQPAPDEDGHYIVLDMGCDNTTLMVSNGKKIWIRNVPLGGNHFTRALTKEMKLSFAKAEHLKCNATKSPDPRAVFQALRPVFNDYVAEIQRSIGFFSSVNRSAKINKVIGLGNGFKLAGLQKFLQQNLQYEVERPDTFKGLAGDSVLNSPLFADNLLSFAVPYGLALQTLKLTTIKTTLLPKEIATERLIRRKKPWAVAAAAALLVGLSLATVGNGNAYRVPHSEGFKAAEEQAKSFAGEVGAKQSAFDGEKGRLTGAQAALQAMVAGSRDDTWLQILKAINDALPRDVPSGVDETKPVELRNQVSVLSLTSKRKADVNAWFLALPAVGKETMSKWDLEHPPAGPGYVFAMEGLHYHHDTNPALKGEGEGILYLRNSLLENLQSWEILPNAQNGFREPQPIGKLGISHACVTFYREKEPVPFLEPKRRDDIGSRLAGPLIRNPRIAPRGSDMMGGDMMSMGSRPGYPAPTMLAPGETPTFVYRTLFKIEFVLQYKKPAERQPNAPWDTSAPADGSTPPAEAPPAS